MMRAALVLLLAGLNLCLPVSAAEIEPLDELLVKVTTAYGGETAREGTKGVRQTGVTYSSMRRQEGRIIRTYQAPDRLRIEILYPETEELRILNGPHAWKREQPMGKPFRDALMLQAVRMGLPWSLLQGRAQLRDLGMQAIDAGQPLRMLELPLGANLAIKVGIDPESGLIMRSVGTMTGSMGVMEFGTVYEDFRTQDGRRYAGVEHHYAAGQATGHTRIDQMEFLDTFPEESLFIPPGPEAKTRQHI
jgi:hypothetical protein